MTDSCLITLLVDKEKSRKETFRCKYINLCILYIYIYNTRSLDMYIANIIRNSVYTFNSVDENFLKFLLYISVTSNLSMFVAFGFEINSMIENLFLKFSFYYIFL